MSIPPWDDEDPDQPAGWGPGPSVPVLCLAATGLLTLGVLLWMAGAFGGVT